MPKAPRTQASGPNPRSPELMSPHERRAELCGLLALGILRLKGEDTAQLGALSGDFPLHNPADQSGTAAPKRRRDA